MIGKMHKNTTMKHYSNNFKCPSRRQQKLQTNQWYFYVKYTTRYRYKKERYYKKNKLLLLIQIL